MMEAVERGTLVFVVDDDREVRHSIADLLVMEGYEARRFRSADAAWNDIAFGDAQPATIILDLWLQGMSSGEFVRRLRQSPQATTPILVLSGWEDAGNVESHVHTVVKKPVEATSLVRIVDKLVRLARTPSPSTSALGGPRRPRRAPRLARRSTGGG